MNRITGKVSFASYIGNAIRYDIELDPETLFKVDVQNPWNQQPFPIGREGACAFSHPDHPGDSRLRREDRQRGTQKTPLPCPSPASGRR